MSVKNKVAIITGASKGIGKEIAIKLSLAGAKVVLVSRNEDRMNEVANEIRNENGSVYICPTDVTNENEVTNMIEQTINEFGTIDILVNNAGDPGPTRPIQDLSLEDWNKVVDSNLTGSFLCTKYAVPYMVKEKHGRIINISSASAKSGLPFRSGYCSAKSAIIGLTRSLALELGPHDICVNAIVPGAVLGDRLDYVIEEQAKQRGVSPEEFRKVWISNFPLGRAVEPQDIANLVVYLAGDSGSNITGEDINVAAGGVIG